MGDHAWLAERFEERRSRLRAVAYRMLGSVSEADDAVQEAWLRLDRADPVGVQNLDGWLTTVVARICLNALRERRSRRETPLDAHLPDPIVDVADGRCWSVPPCRACASTTFGTERPACLSEPASIRASPRSYSDTPRARRQWRSTATSVPPNSAKPRRSCSAPSQQAPRGTSQRTQYGRVPLREVGVATKR